MKHRLKLLHCLLRCEKLYVLVLYFPLPNAKRVSLQLLDFSKYPQWHTALIKLLEPEDSSKSLSSLKPGDKVKCNIDGMKFVASITVSRTDPFAKRA